MASVGLRAVRSRSYRLVASLSRLPEKEGRRLRGGFTYKVEGLAFWLISYQVGVIIVDRFIQFT